MNVSMVVLNQFTHDTRVMKEAQTLQASGYQVTVNALWAPGLPFFETLPEGIRVIRFRQRTRENLSLPLLAWIELISKLTPALLKQEPSICHAHDLNGLIAIFLGSRLTNSKIVYDSHEFEIGRQLYNQEKKNWRRYMKAWMEKWLIHRTENVITVSNTIASELARINHIPKPLVVRNVPKFFEFPTAGLLRSAAGWGEDCPIILYQGGLVKGRGIEYLMQGVAKVPEVYLAILGDGPMERNIASLAKDLAIENRLYKPGKVALNSLLEYTRDGTIGTCLYENTCLNNYYSLPNKLFEYLMAGVPVLASDFPDLRQVTLGAEAGCVVDPSNPQEIADTLRTMLSDRAKLAEMAANARRVALESYNWEKESQKLLALYNEIQSSG